jgi:hypothetical protein
MGYPVFFTRRYGGRGMNLTSYRHLYTFIAYTVTTLLSYLDSAQTQNRGFILGKEKLCGTGKEASDIFKKYVTRHSPEEYHDRHRKIYA